MEGGGGNFNCIHLISDLRKKHHKCWKYCSTIGLQFGCLCCFSTQSAFVHAGWPCKCLWIICVFFFFHLCSSKSKSEVKYVKRLQHTKFAMETKEFTCLQCYSCVHLNHWIFLFLWFLQIATLWQSSPLVLYVHNMRFICAPFHTNITW